MQIFIRLCFIIELKVNKNDNFIVKIKLILQDNCMENNMKGCKSVQTRDKNGCKNYLICTCYQEKDLKDIDEDTQSHKPIKVSNR